MFSMWARRDMSGTTPPHFLCKSVDEDTTDESTFRSVSTATAVSSKLVSIASMFIKKKNITELLQHILPKKRI